MGNRASRVLEWRAGDGETNLLGLMAIEVLATFLSVSVETSGGAGLAGKIREHRLDGFLSALPDPERRAFLEIVAAAILDDGKLSDAEKAWLDARRETAGDDLVNAAIATATSVMPPREDAGALRAFLAERADRLASDAHRERAFAAAALALHDAGGAGWREHARTFAEALRVAEVARASLIEGVEAASVASAPAAST